MDASEAARALRAIPSEKRAQASRENGRNAAAKGVLGGRPVKPLSEIECNCGAADVHLHKPACLRGQAVKRRLARNLPLE